jgi:hypothetical protein
MSSKHRHGHVPGGQGREGRGALRSLVPNPFAPHDGACPSSAGVGTDTDWKVSPGGLEAQGCKHVRLPPLPRTHIFHMSHTQHTLVSPGGLEAQGCKHIRLPQFRLQVLGDQGGGAGDEGVQALYQDQVAGRGLGQGQPEGGGGVYVCVGCEGVGGEMRQQLWNSGNPGNITEGNGDTYFSPAAASVSCALAHHHHMPGAPHPPQTTRQPRGPPPLPRPPVARLVGPQARHLLHAAVLLVLRRVRLPQHAHAVPGAQRAADDAAVGVELGAVLLARGGVGVEGCGRGSRGVGGRGVWVGGEWEVEVGGD